MGIARRMLRNQVRKNLKKSKKEVPAEYRAAITFSSVFNMVRSGAQTSPAVSGDKVNEERLSEDESAEAEQEIII